MLLKGKSKFIRARWQTALYWNRQRRLGRLSPDTPVTPTTTFLASYYSGTEDDLKALVTGTGPASSIHTSTDHQPEHPSLGGTYRPFLTDEEVWKWGRWVTSIAKYSGDLVNAAWYVGGGAIKVGETDIIGPKGELVTVMEVDFSTLNTDEFRQNVAAVAGETYNMSYFIRMKTGVGDIKVKSGSVLSGNIPIDTSWKRLTGYSTEGSSGTKAFSVYNSNPGVAKTVYIYIPQIEIVTGNLDPSIPSEAFETFTADPVTKVLYDTNGNTVSSNVVTEAPGIALVDPEPEQVAHAGGENAQIKSNDQSDAEYTKTNGTAAKTEAGLRADANGSCLLTATSANFTCIANAVTAASGTHATKWFLKRKTGTGVVELTVDGGTTWQAVTVTDTNLFYPFAVDQAGVTNPQIGIRIVTSGDEVIVGNAESHLDKLFTDVIFLGPIFTDNSAIPLSDLSNTWPLENHVDQAGTSIEIDYQGGTIDVLSLGGTPFLSIASALTTTPSGPELVTIDGGFDSSTGWTLRSGATISGSKFNFNAGGAFSSYFSQTVVIGEWKVVSLDVVVTSGSFIVQYGDSDENVTINSSGSYAVLMTTGSVDNHFYFIPSSDCEAEIDNLSIKEPTIVDFLTLSDGTNSVATAITIGRQTIGWVADTSKMQLLVNGSWSAETTFDGSFGSGEIECYLPSWRYQSFAGGTYDQQKQLVLEESYTILVADTGEILTAEDGTTILIED